MNDQRRVIYEQRSDIMDAETVDDVVADMRTETVNALVADHCPPGTYPEQWNVEGLKEAVGDILNLEPDIDAWMEEDALDPELIETRLAELADQAVAEKAASLDPASWHMVEKNIRSEEHTSELQSLMRN